MVEYFSHDYDARHDSKLVKLQIEMGHEGKGIYWDLIEYLYQQDGKLKISDLDAIAYTLHTTVDKINKVIDIAFRKDFDCIVNNRVLKNIEERKFKAHQKSEAGRVGGIASGISRKEATVKQPLSNTLSETNETKQSKVKESKGKESKVKESKEVSISTDVSKTENQCLIENPVIMTFVCAGKVNTWDLRKDFHDTLRSAYPDVDVGVESKKADAWLKSNRLKTASGMRRFLNNWMSLQQNGGYNGFRKNGVNRSGDNTAGTVAASKYDKVCQ